MYGSTTRDRHVIVIVGVGNGLFVQLTLHVQIHVLTDTACTVTGRTRVETSVATGYGSKEQSSLCYQDSG